MSAVADQGQGFLGDAGEDQFAGRAQGQRLRGVGVDDLGDEVVLGDVHPRFMETLHGHGRTHDLRESVDVQGGDSQPGLDLGAHLL